MAYSDILSRLKTDIEAVTGIGLVYDYKRLVKDDHTKKELLETGGKMHFWEISREDATDPTDYLTLVVNKDDYTIQGWYALDDSAGSEKVFQAVVDGVRAALNGDRLLNSLGYIVDPITASPITEEMKGNVLCHTAKMTARILTTTDLS